MKKDPCKIHLSVRIDTWQACVGACVYVCAHVLVKRQICMCNSNLNFVKVAQTIDQSGV